MTAVKALEQPKEVRLLLRREARQKPQQLRVHGYFVLFARTVYEVVVAGGLHEDTRIDVQRLRQAEDDGGARVVDLIVF